MTISVGDNPSPVSQLKECHFAVFPDRSGISTSDLNLFQSIAWSDFSFGVFLSHSSFFPPDQKLSEFISTPPSVSAICLAIVDFPVPLRPSSTTNTGPPFSWMSCWICSLVYSSVESRCSFLFIDKFYQVRTQFYASRSGVKKLALVDDVRTYYLYSKLLS